MHRRLGAKPTAYPNPDGANITLYESEGVTNGYLASSNRKFYAIIAENSLSLLSDTTCASGRIAALELEAVSISWAFCGIQSSTVLMIAT
jgi:hypothetical protein